MSVSRESEGWSPGSREWGVGGEEGGEGEDVPEDVVMEDTRRVSKMVWAMVGGVVVLLVCLGGLVGYVEALGPRPGIEVLALVVGGVGGGVVCVWGVGRWRGEVVRMVLSGELGTLEVTYRGKHSETYALSDVGTPVWGRTKRSAYCGGGASGRRRLLFPLRGDVAPLGIVPLWSNQSTVQGGGEELEYAVCAALQYYTQSDFPQVLDEQWV